MNRLAWLLFAVVIPLALIGIALGVVEATSQADFPPGRASELYVEVFAIVASVLIATVGLLIARKESANPIGWIFLGSAALIAVMTVAYRYADLVLYGGEDWPGGAWVAWLASWLIIVPVFVAPCLVAQLFPDGRPIGGRWHRLFWLSVASAAYVALSPALNPGPTGSYPHVDNPIGLPHWVGTLLFDPVWALAIFGLFAISLASIVARFRRSVGIERQQLSWLTLAAGIGIVGLVGGFVFYDLVGWLSTLFMAVAAVGLVLMPVAVAIAILRYRLYEIDRIVSRTLVYASLTLVLGAAYAGLVLAGQALFSSFAGGSNLAIAVSTLVIAALFLPLRTRIQQVVDRRFNRRGYDAQRTLEAFGSRLRDQVELEVLAHDLRAIVAETMQPAHVTFWLREPTG